MEGHCWMLAADSPVVLSCFVFFCLFFKNLILFSFSLFLLTQNVNITVWGHWIKSEFIHFFNFLVILPYCAYAYSILWSLTFQGNSSQLFFTWYVGSIGISLINPFILSQLKIPLGKTAYYCMHFKDKFRLWSEAWICQRF